MPYVILKRSRKTRNYYLLESHRDRKTGKVKKTVLAYLGTEASGLSTPERAHRYWERELKRLEGEVSRARGKERERLRREAHRVGERLARIVPYSTHVPSSPGREERTPRSSDDSTHRGPPPGRPVTAKQLEREIRTVRSEFAKSWRQVLIAELGYEEPGRVRIEECRLGKHRRRYAVYSLGARDVLVRALPPSPWFEVLEAQSFRDFMAERGWRVLSKRTGT